jgi:hypothetical protein
VADTRLTGIKAELAVIRTSKPELELLGPALRSIASIRIERFHLYFEARRGLSRIFSFVSDGLRIASLQGAAVLAVAGILCATRTRATAPCPP